MVMKRNDWLNYESAFNSLGSQKLGMTPAVASALAMLAFNRLGGGPGTHTLPLTAHPAACYATEPTDLRVDCQWDFQQCQQFIKVNESKRIVEITPDGVQYVKNHWDVFQLLCK